MKELQQQICNLIFSKNPITFYIDHSYQLKMSEENKTETKHKRRMLVYFSALLANWGFSGMVAVFSMVKKPLAEDLGI